MRFARELLFFAFMSGLAIQCHVTQPPTGPDTGYPCGVWGVECSNGACCPWAHICGVEGDPWRRCAVGYCCADGDPFYGLSGVDGGPAVKARPAR